MDALALARQQLGVEHLLHERVAQLEAAGTAHERVPRDEHAGVALHRLARHQRERRHVDGRLGRGDEPEQLHLRLRQAREPRVHDALEVGRDARLGRHGEQLLDVEGVALRQPHEVLDLRVGRLRAGDGVRELRDPRPAERGELDPLGRVRVQALERIQQRQQRDAQLVGPEGGHEQHLVALRQAAGEERDQPARGGIGPVQVLEHDDQRREPLEDAQHELADLRRRRRGSQPVEVVAHRVVEVRLGDQRAQHRRQRRVGHGLGADRQAAADQHGGALGARDLRELGDEPRLADPRLARHQQHAGALLAGAVERSDEAAQLLAPPDQAGADDPSHFGGILPVDALPVLPIRGPGG